MTSPFDETELVLHQKWVIGQADGKRQDHADAVFRHITLTDANLISSVFDRCRLENVTFKNVEFNGSSFSTCALSECRFDRCIMQDCTFIDSGFQRCYFSGSHLQGCTFSYCEISGGDFTSTDLTKAAFYKCGLAESNLSNSKLKRTDFSLCNLRRCNFSHSIAERAAFSDTDLRGSIIEGMAMNRTFFTDCGLNGLGGKPVAPNSAIITQPDYSLAFDRSDIVSAEKVINDWSCPSSLGGPSKGTNVDLKHIDVRASEAGFEVIVDDYELFDFIEDIVIDKGLEYESMSEEVRGRRTLYTMHFGKKVSEADLTKLIETISPDEIQRIWDLNNPGSVA